MFLVWFIAYLFINKLSIYIYIYIYIYIVMVYYCIGIIIIFKSDITNLR